MDWSKSATEGRYEMDILGSRLHACHWIGTLLCCVCCWLNANESRGDFGPKGFDVQTFRITQQGSKWTKPFVAALLMPANSRSNRTLNMAEKLPGYDEIEPTADGKYWVYANYAWGGRGAAGTTNFHGFYGPIPSKFRLAIFSIAESRLYLSDELNSHPLLTIYDVEIAEDRLVVSQPSVGLWIADQFLGLQRHGFLWAVLVTLLVEMSLILLWIYRWQRGSLWRFAWLAAAINMATLSFVWVGSLIAFWMLGFETGLVVFWGLEISVWGIESVTYRYGGKLKWREALSLSAIGNILTVMIGVVANGWL